MKLKPNLLFKLINENFWERKPEFAALNPAMQVPVLVDEDKNVIADSFAICEYIDAKYQNNPMLGKTLIETANIRRLVSWFDVKFFNEVTVFLNW